MQDLEKQIRTRYLDRLDDRSWREYHPKLDYGIAALPFFAAAFERETHPEHRVRLVRVIWEFRDNSALPLLSIALQDSFSEVWKESLDGIVAIGGEKGLAVLKDALATVPDTDASDKRSWIMEAISQVEERINAAETSE
jgi:hypothetical protein